MNLFAYGTLMISEVMEALTARSFTSEQAVLHHAARFALKGCVYPALIAKANSSVPGRLYYDLDAATVNLLDAYETDLYVQKGVTAQTANGSLVAADAYFCSAPADCRLADRPWSAAEFKAGCAEDYLQECKLFRREYLRECSVAADR